MLCFFCVFSPPWVKYVTIEKVLLNNGSHKQQPSSWVFCDRLVASPVFRNHRVSAAAKELTSVATKKKKRRKIGPFAFWWVEFIRKLLFIISELIVRLALFPGPFNTKTQIMCVCGSYERKIRLMRLCCAAEARRRNHERIWPWTDQSELACPLPAV